MGLQHKSDQVAAPAAGVVLERLYKDAALTKYDVFAIDVMDPQSWSKQAAPAVGDTIIDISPADGADATFTAPLLAFNGGLISDGSSIQKLDLPASCQPAPTSRGNIALVWAYIPAAPNAVRKLCGWLRSGPTTGVWGAYLAGNVSGLQLQTFQDGVGLNVNLPASGLYLLAMGRVEDGAGGFQYRRRIIRASDGSIVSTAGAASSATAAQPSATAPCTIGGDGTFGASAVMRFYRMRMVDVKENAAVATAAWFDALVDNEFALNRARADWVVP